MRTKAFIIFLFLFVFSFQCLAHDTDLYVLDQSMEQVPPDILFVLDLSGSMRYTPAGEYMYIPDSVSCSSSSSCPSNTPFYPTSGVGHTKSCDIDIDSGREYPSYAIPVYSNSSCTGPFYKTYSSSDPTRNTNCSRLEIAKRGIKKILDANDDGSVTDPVDQNTLNMRMGYMRFYNCANSSSDSGDNYSSGCNTLRKALDTPYSQIWSSVNGENAYNGTHLAYSLKEAKLYLDDHKNGNQARGMNPDPAKACRKKFVISLLPPPVTEGPVRAEWRFVPSAQLGGDSLGYHWIDKEHFAMYLLDVCDHGVGPALLSVSALNVLRSQTLPNTDFRVPEKVLASLNDTFQMEHHNNLYFTIWYGVFNAASGRLTYASAGNSQAVLIANNGTVTDLTTPNMLIGGMPDVPYTSSCADIERPARLYIFSDGVYEVKKPDGQMWSIDEFKDFLVQTAAAQGSEMDALYTYLQKLQGGSVLDDDFSMLKIRFV